MNQIISILILTLAVLVWGYNIQGGCNLPVYLPFK